MIQIVTTETPDGPFHLLLDSSDVAHASGYGPVDNLIQRLPLALQRESCKIVANHQYQKIILAYYDGDAGALDAIPRTQEGTDFQKRVWQAIAVIPPGDTISYKQLAIAAGNPTAIRAAGTICGLNRLILLVPCHRVLKSDGGIGSYLYGSKIKESLLLREGALVVGSAA